jgi:CBS domain-containing protein
MSVRTVLEQKGAHVFSVPATMSLKVATSQMRAHAIAALVVKRGDQIVGVLSERDIVNAIARDGQDALSMSVASVLSHSFVTVSPGDSIKHAMRLMTHHRVRHLLAINEGRLEGIVSIGDVVKHRLQELELESSVLRDAYIAAH